MRSLNSNEASRVAGGNNASTARNAAIKQCEGLPDDTKVTFTINIESNISGKVVGIGGESTTTQTVTIETNCGALRGSK